LNKPLYYPVNAGDVNEFGQKVDTLASALTAQVKQAYSGEEAAGSVLTATTKTGGDPKKSDCAVDTNTNNELAFIQSCLKTKPEPKQILEIIASAKQANKCAIAQRLYANQAQGGNVEIALAYAEEYEKGSSCFQADKETAIYWYETALSNDPNNATAKEKLEALKK
jgi:hypothetical protein